MKYAIFILAVIMCGCGERLVPPPVPTAAESAVQVELAKSKAQVATLTADLGAKATTIAQEDARIHAAEEQVIAADATAYAAKKVLIKERSDRADMARLEHERHTALILDWASGLLALAAIACGIAAYFMPIEKTLFITGAVICAGLSPTALALAVYVHYIPYLGVAILTGSIAFLWYKWHGHASALVELAKHPVNADVLANLKGRTHAIIAKIQAKAHKL